jgi:hypothetical protein
MPRGRSGRYRCTAWLAWRSGTVQHSKVDGLRRSDKRREIAGGEFRQLVFEAAGY